jgi:hypothetical protein
VDVCDAVGVDVGGTGVLDGVRGGLMVGVAVNVFSRVGEGIGALVFAASGLGVAVAVDVGVCNTSGDGVPEGGSIATCNTWNRAQNTTITATSSTSSVVF